MRTAVPKLKINGSFSQFVQPLRNREAFDTHGSLRGIVGKTYGGILPEIYKESAHSADYTVLSYATPIAWFVPNGSSVDIPSNCVVEAVSSGYWIMPDVRYSVTTSKQQGRIRTALSVLNNPSY